MHSDQEFGSNSIIVGNLRELPTEIKGTFWPFNN